VWAIAESASGIQVARSPWDLAARSPEVLALGFASHEVPRSQDSCGCVAEHKVGPCDRGADTRYLEIGVNPPLNSRILGIRRIGG
jgi:hypothetical protein